LQLVYKEEQWVSKVGKENFPMVMVNYFGALEFCKWAGGKLPSKEEWLFAASGGNKSKNYIYAGSNNLDEVGWFRGNCEKHSHEVGQKLPNELGIFDMSGNAWEWCLNDSLKSDRDFCVHMGGSWYPGEEPSRLSAHYGNTPDHFSNSVGFRVMFPLENSSSNYYSVPARKNALDTVWKNYTAKTIDRLPNFTFSADPQISDFGGWKTFKKEVSGFFRTEKIDDRWWIIDPDGYPFIHKGVAVFRPGSSENQAAALKSKYGSKATWVKQESELLRENGFNGTGAWSDVELLRKNNTKLVYSIIVSPMGSYKSDHIKKYGGKYEMAGWQGYRFDLAMVFDPEFDAYVEKAIAPIANYKNDKYLLGYYTDNELPWKNDALDRHLKYLGKDEPGYIAAKEWFNKRKGFEADTSDILEEDREAFSAFYFETYIKKVSEAIHKYDPNHMYLGCRFNQENEELNNAAIFKVAGQYADIISINHYRKWEPDQSIMANWQKWSGKPFLITEWYTKGEDSGLPNNTGAGWNVRTQADRGYFYQNFTLELLKSKACVGWHWFTYQDNDPNNFKTDPSNRDSNKGIVNSSYEPYAPLLENMKMLNDHVYELIQFIDKK
jgi:hypothetical protein